MYITNAYIHTITTDEKGSHEFEEEQVEGYMERGGGREEKGEIGEIL